MIKQTIWITGAAGRLGTQLLQLLEKNSEYKLIGTDTDVDVTDIEAVEHAVEIYRPSVVINCASISDAAYCEENMVEAFKVNALGARNVASASRRVGAKLIQLSTDDVFEETEPEQMTEFDTPLPVSVYGKSKLAGENFVRELNPKHLILRSSWVYGTAKSDYFGFVAEHGEKGESFEAPLDRISSPTSAAELSRFVEKLIDAEEYGIFHASCEGVCSRYEFAKEILFLMGYDTALVKGVKTREDGKRSSTVLENLMLKMTGLQTMPNWHDDLEAYVKSVRGN